MAPHPIVVLWTVPRSVSTAFERMMMERGDVAVVHEPFSLAYYFGADKRSDRYDEVRPGSTPDEIFSTLEEAARERPVFVKDMAYHAEGLLDDDRLHSLTHTFLVRDPAWTIPSLAAHWPDFTDEEIGFRSLERLVEGVAATGEHPVVVDSDDLRADPVGTVAAYCDAIGLPFLPDSLTWEPGMPAAWEVWADWHRDAAASRGFLPPDDSSPPALTDPRTRDAYERCAPVYERLRERCRRITPRGEASRP